MIPMYPHKDIPNAPTSQANFGLWYDKFCNQWSEDNLWSFKKKEWIEQAESFRFNDRDIVHEFVSRRVQMIQSLGGRFWVFETLSPFVTGLGRTHPVENGMVWDYLSGLPFIPGSSIKGALKASNRQYFENHYDITERFTIFDAIPLGSVTLRGEIMTPHYAPYYQKQESPGDWFSPTPIPFLTVPKGQRFLFSIVAPSEHLNRIEEWLEETLTWAGLGAKTAVAFGRFRRIQAEEQRLIREFEETLAQKRQAEQMQSLSPVEQELLADGYHDNSDRFMQALTQKWLDKMEDVTLPEDDRILIAQKLKDWYLKNKNQEWNKPKNKKNQQKIARIKKVL
ncbi:type III-B CRISPR module RAMP protein Cmr6 [Sulfobacillus thermosulfidooxidans]|uniref:type III-B CRISPR module RAMP protein Cmr6 n=1 Tax=Sulfobacillus thermosulfidooxidans TaxID=28034 RepID=UPI0006B697D1|nr:type III-B CRISPR module RAMP protein Cmr6 [Sulfobacillus thermosulfidooxidans]